MALCKSAVALFKGAVLDSQLVHMPSAKCTMARYLRVVGSRTQTLHKVWTYSDFKPIIAMLYIRKARMRGQAVSSVGDSNSDVFDSMSSQRSTTVSTVSSMTVVGTVAVSFVNLIQLRCPLCVNRYVCW